MSVSGIGGAEEGVGVGSDGDGILIIEAADRQSTAEHDTIELKPDREEAAAVELALLDEARVRRRLVRGGNVAYAS